MFLHIYTYIYYRSYCLDYRYYQDSWHYDDVIMSAITSQITSLTIVYSTVYSDADQRKHQSSASLAFVWGFHRDRWIPRKKGQLRGKCSHLMTSSWKAYQPLGLLLPLDSITGNFSCFVSMWLHVYEQFPYDSSDWFTHIIQGFVIGTGAIVGVPQRQFGNPNRYGKIVSTRPQQK